MSRIAAKSAAEHALWLLAGSGKFPPGVAPRVAVTNFIGLFGLLMTGVLSLVQAQGGYVLLIVTNQLSATVFATLLALNYFGWHRCARVLLLLYTHAALLVYSYLYGADVGLINFFYPLIVVPFVLFTAAETAIILTLSGLAMVLSVFVNVHARDLMPGVLKLDPAVLASMHTAYAVFVVIALFLPAFLSFVLTRKHEAALRAEQLMAMQLAKLKALGEIAGGIAHEINNPLAIIKGKLRQFQETGGDLRSAQGLTTIAIVEQMSDRIVDIVANVLRLARDATMRQFRPVNVAELIERTLGICQEQFRLQHTELRVIPGPRDAAVSGEMLQLNQALLGLLHNALDATEKHVGGWVEIAVAVENREVSISVTDNGAGVPAHLRDKIMEPFFTTKPVGSGTGLGLSIAATTAIGHGGRVLLDTDAPHTRFILRLPLLLLPSAR
jgi:signal transduction histidine kinase